MFSPVAFFFKLASCICYSWDIYLELADQALSESFISFIYNLLFCRCYSHNSILHLRWWNMFFKYIWRKFSESGKVRISYKSAKISQSYQHFFLYLRKWNKQSQNLSKLLTYATFASHTRFFYKQHFYKQRQAEIDKKLSKC